MNIQFNDFPFEAKNKTMSYAEMAEAAHSQHLVKENEKDAFYFRALESKGILLNKPQIEAVRHVEGPLLTLAGAGSGKTSVLVSRTGYLMTVQGISARQILLVTFTKKAATEMRERIAQLPGVSFQQANQIQARTFHSFFLILLKSSGYDHEILSHERYKQLIMKRLLKEKGLEDHYQPETLLSTLSYYKVNLVAVEDIPSKSSSEKDLKNVLVAYEKWKQNNHQLDFDDILLEAYQLLKKTPTLLKNLQERFRYIMVDEFQDTNPLQYELVKMLAQSHHNLVVVGDDDQTIYSFNGAQNDLILNFDKEFSEAKTVTLNINYRSTQSIVGLGNQVIKHNRKRKKKTLQATKTSSEGPQFIRPDNTDKEAEMIVQHIKEKVEGGDWQYSEIAILHRTANNSRAMFEQLTLQDIPFIDHAAGDKIFYEQWPVSTVVNYLKLVMDPRDLKAIEDILPTLYVNRQKGLAHIRNKDENKKRKKLLTHLLTLPQLRDFQKENIKKRIDLIDDLKAITPLAAIKKIRTKFYDQFLETGEHQNTTLVKETIRESLDELEASSKRFSDIHSFLTFVENMVQKHKDMKFLKGEHGANAVSMMTIHRSKGLEFPVVYLIGASDGILPHVTALEATQIEDRVSGGKKSEKVIVNDAIEEERRLCYVAITRAKHELYISSPAYYRGDKAEVSQFLLEAFGQESVSRGDGESQTPNYGRSRSGKEGNHTSSRKSSTYRVTVLAWLCTSETCNGWQRILTQEEAEQDHKDCPLCHGIMMQGAKEIYQ